MNLSLEYLQSGHTHCMKRWAHLKTIPFLIIVHALEGEYVVRVGHRKWRVPVGTTFVMPPNVEVEFDHFPSKRGLMRAVWAHATCMVHRTYEWSDFYDLPGLIQGEASMKILQRLESLNLLPVSSKPSLSQQAEQSSLAYDLFHLLSESLSEKSSSIPRLQDIRLSELYQFMRLNISLPLSISNLAGSVGLSRAQFHEFVKGVTNKTPHLLLLELRIETAAKLLIHPQWTLDYIARECGFQCPFHFSKVFKKIKGISPSRYRHQAIEALNTYRSGGKQE